jgi:hypothetical protein
MTQFPIGIGNRLAQERFIWANKELIVELDNLHRLLETDRLRAIELQSIEQTTRLSQLSADDPESVRFEDEKLASAVIFGLGRIIMEDFAEILVLCGNGYGFGAQKLLRGMYERLVTATFIAKKPSEARPFVEDDATKKWKLWNRGLGDDPNLNGSAEPELIAKLEAEYKRVKDRNVTSICKKCGQPTTKEAWTRVDLATMAKEADPALASVYAACYLIPTFHSHATGFGLSARLSDSSAESLGYGEDSELEARRALLYAHNLLLQNLGLLDKHFGLGLSGEIQTRVDAFVRIWPMREQNGDQTNQL